MALEKLGERDNAAVAEALVKQLTHSDRGLREAALASLAKLEAGRAALTAALFDADSADRAWQMAKAQASFVREYPDSSSRCSTGPQSFSKPATAAWTHCYSYCERRSRRSLRDRLEQRALAWRKKKDYALALLYLRDLLGRDPACGFALRLEQAACGLKISGKDLSADSRSADPCLQQFTQLAQQDDGQLAEQIEKLKWLEPEDVFYLGFHLAEQLGRARKVAEQLLHQVVKRSPRTKVGQAAKSKLRMPGWNKLADYHTMTCCRNNSKATFHAACGLTKSGPVVCRSGPSAEVRMAARQCWLSACSMRMKASPRLGADTFNTLSEPAGSALH